MDDWNGGARLSFGCYRRVTLEEVCGFNYLQELALDTNTFRHSMNYLKKKNLLLLSRK